MVPPMSTEPWRWGDLFEVDVPLTMTARDLSDMIELRIADSAAPLLLAAFSPVPGPPDRTTADALTRFSATRGLNSKDAQAGLQLTRDPDGVVAGRLAFVTDLCWEAYALSWRAEPSPSSASSASAPTSGEQATLVLAFCAATTQDDAIFAAAEDLLSTVRPLDLLVAASDHLPPEAPGEF